MVSLWPWRDNTSAAGFEKTLSTLSTKIQKASTTSDTLRKRSRKIKVMWTLYTGFAYILAALILTLITGWQNWGPIEYTGIAGGPLVIYGIRQGFTAYYNYRISNTQSYLDNLYKERDATIEKLKEATKYNSTQQLLEKYGTPRQSPQKTPLSVGNRRGSGEENQARPGTSQSNSGRTNNAPPPTANISRNNPQPAQPFPNSRPVTPAELTASPFPPFAPGQHPLASPMQEQHPGPLGANAEFAPNAFAPQYAPDISEPRWYDRIMDVLLGEDEMQPKNRIALICAHCRLVNGQAPPGTKTLGDLGKWKCMGCGGWNGQENEAQKLVEQISKQARANGVAVKAENGSDEGVGKPLWRVSDADADDGASARSFEEETGSDDIDDAAPPARSTRSKTKNK